LCLELARDGHTILATDKDYGAAAQTVSLMAEPAAAQAFKLDVTSASDVNRFAQEVADRLVGVLINNAGLQHVAPIERFPAAKWKEIIDVVLGGSAAMIQSLLPGMREHGFGRIVNIGSIHSLVASPYKAAYVAAKHGLIGLSKVIALETADVDITINTICPAYIRTPLVDAQIADQAVAHGVAESEVVANILLKPMPKKTFVTIEEIAGAVRFLISPDARNMTGQTLVLDGGWTAH
jgi:3-hydroxybutyrate dehydrogenase